MQGSLCSRALCRARVTVNLYPRTAAARCAALEGIAGDVRTLWVVGWELPPPLVPPMASPVLGEAPKEPMSAFSSQRSRLEGAWWHTTRSTNKK